MSGTLHPIYGSLPWHTSEDASGRVFARNGEKIARVEFFQGEAKKMIKREEAIARLLAAAPALRESLSELYEFFNVHLAEKYGNDFPVLIKARAALKAAE